MKFELIFENIKLLHILLFNLYIKQKIDKEVNAIKDSQQKIIIHKGNNEIDNVTFCMDKVKDLLEDGYTKDDILFLDEPTNHLDFGAIRWLENYLLEKGYRQIFNQGNDKYLLLLK